jgi:hypothetical protein
MKNKTRKMYMVTKAIWGADSPVDLFFETLEGAEAFYQEQDYVDNPESVRVPENQVRHLLGHTYAYLYRLS